MVDSLRLANGFYQALGRRWHVALASGPLLSRGGEVGSRLAATASNCSQARGPQSPAKPWPLGEPAGGWVGGFSKAPQLQSL